MKGSAMNQKTTRSNCVLPCWTMSLNPKVYMKLCAILILFLFITFSLSSSKLTSVMNLSLRIRAQVADAMSDLVSSNYSETNALPNESFPRYFEVEENKRLKLEQHVPMQNIVVKQPTGDTGTGTNASVGVKLLSINPYTTKDSSVTFKEKEIIKAENVDIFGNIYGSKNKTRKPECKYCFEHNFKYLIQNTHICKQNVPGQKIDLIILITTTHKNFNARTALRKTWLTITKNNTANVRYAFLLGAIPTTQYSKLVEQENNQYHDIIKEDFVDSYNNLTYKTIMAYKWASTICSNAEYVMKTDDDMFVNVPNVLRLVKGVNKENLQNSILGSCSKKAKPIRNLKSKWFASPESYPDTYYPGFCSGTGYVTSMNVARKVYEISPSVPYFHLEDVYVSLCIKKLGYHLQGTKGFNPGRPKLDPCLYKGPSLLTAHRLPPSILTMLWRRECQHRPLRLRFAQMKT